jgi:hypothetical protein
VRQHFNLSRKKSLRTLETTSASITGAGDGAASGFLKSVLATIAPTLPLDVVIASGNYDLGYSVVPWSSGVEGGRSYSKKGWSSHCLVLCGVVQVVQRDAYGSKVSPYPLCRCPRLDCGACYEGAGERIVDTEKENGRLNYLPHDPLVISEVRSFCTFRGDDSVGKRGRCIPPNAL